ncbi:MOSC domain-containing protein [Paenibacillus xylaniclasticus]|uniref:MOSC domain-containing protein n=1 Tax=Paenibacillus xylaniclasticus TaxID=588083 RepID=UPI000FD8BD26|nr:MULTISPECIES: MOSC domain-containing protein [Paenibacillus]GFN32329.1 MOSC domain-containing protein [Paenibacillus curdlanolyticus]
MKGTNATIISVNVGLPASLKHGEKVVVSGIRKQSVQDRIKVSFDGLPGDGQADLVNHGGPDKAVCVYSFDHYPYWEERLGRQLEAGSFGENFTLSGRDEEDWCIGDKVRIGTALLQVSQPRQPCFKLGARHGVPELGEWVTATGYTGFYFRVLIEGEVKAGDKAVIEERHDAAITIAEANLVMHHNKSDLAGIRKLLAVDELSASWRKTLQARLDRLTGESELEKVN